MKLIIKKITIELSIIKKVQKKASCPTLNVFTTLNIYCELLDTNLKKYFH